MGEQIDGKWETGIESDGKWKRVVEKTTTGMGVDQQETGNSNRKAENGDYVENKSDSWSFSMYFLKRGQAMDAARATVQVDSLSHIQQAMNINKKNALSLVCLLFFYNFLATQSHHHILVFHIAFA